MDKILSLCGLARRARKVITGTDAVIDFMSKGKVNLIFVASDASDATKDKMDKKCFFYHVNIIDKYTSLEIDQAIGTNNSKVIGIIDKGFASEINKLLNKNN